MIIAETERLIPLGPASGDRGRLRCPHHAFGVLCLPWLISIIDPRNAASIRFAEKAGLRYEKDVIFQGFSDRVCATARLER